MNFSTRIKTKRKSPEKISINPKYVLNVSIDIPLKTRYAITSRLNSSQIYHSPNRLKRMYQVSMTPLKTKSRSQSVHNPSNNNNLNNKSTQQHRKLASISFSKPIKNKNKNQKYNKSVDLSLKSTAKQQKYNNLETSSKGSKVIRNISVLQCLQKDQNDNTIRYTNKTQEQGLQKLQPIKLISSSSQLQLLNVRQIRQFQTIATQRRQYINYQYLKNIQMQASAKKIQRFWRKYRTKKLIQTYSFDKIKNKSSLNKTNFSLSQESKGNFWKKKKGALLINQQKQESQQIGKLNRCCAATDLTNIRKIIEDKNSSITSQQYIIKNSQIEISPIRQNFKINLKDTEELQHTKDNSLKEPTRNIQAKLQQFKNEDQQKQRLEKYLQKIKDSKQRNSKQIPSNSSQNSQQQILFQKNHHRLTQLINHQNLNDQFDERNLKKVFFQQQQEQYVQKLEDQYGYEATAEKRKQKIQFFEEQIRKINDQIQQLSNSSISLSPQQNKLLQALENQKLRKKLNLFDKMQVFYIQNMQMDINQQQSHQYLLKRKENIVQSQKQHKKQKQINDQMKSQMDRIVRSKQNKLEQNRRISRNKHKTKKQDQQQNKRQYQVLVEQNLKQKQTYSFNPFQGDDVTANRKQLINKRSKKDYTFQNYQNQFKDHNQYQKQLQQQNCTNQKEEENYGLPRRLQKLSIMQQLQLCKSIGQQLILQFLMDLSAQQSLSQGLKNIFNINKAKNKKQDQSKKDQKVIVERPQGICTNLESIKEYLQNLVSFILEKHETTIKKNINTQAGPTPLILFQYLRRIQVEELSSSQSIIPLTLFEKHWQMASQQIYFDKKFDDQNLQKERMKYLKSLTKVYFRSIFDGFNQALQYNRVFGLMGKPYPWKKASKFDKKPQQIKQIMRISYRKISKIATVYCGLHFSDKKHSIPLQIMRDVQQQRMNNLLQMQLEDDQLKWNFYDDQQAETIYQISLLIQQQILNEVLREIQQFF